MSEHLFSIAAGKGCLHSIGVLGMSYGACTFCVVRPLLTLLQASTTLHHVLHASSCTAYGLSVMRMRLTHMAWALQVGIVRSLLDIAAGMDYLHSIGVLHGDLKSANVLLKSTTTDPRGFLCKLADFGLSRVLDLDMTHISTKTYGTISYMPAELLSQGKMTKQADVYSFAMLSKHPHLYSMHALMLCIMSTLPTSAPSTLTYTTCVLQCSASCQVSPHQHNGVARQARACRAASTTRQQPVRHTTKCLCLQQFSFSFTFPHGNAEQQLQHDRQYPPFVHVRVPTRLHQL